MPIVLIILGTLIAIVSFGFAAVNMTSSKFGDFGGFDNTFKRIVDVLQNAGLL